MLSLSKVLLNPGKSLITSKTLCNIILKEVFPESQVELPFDITHLDESQVPYVISVLTLQVYIRLFVVI